MNENAFHKILIIDDDDANRFVLEMILKQEGFLPISATDGRSGIEAARREAPALILLDVFLPGEDGFDILLQIKNDSELASIPVMIFTVLERPQSRRRAMAMGACDYVTKPFDITEIVTAVKNRLTPGGDCG